jgi:hypothetical protein
MPPRPAMGIVLLSFYFYAFQYSRFSVESNLVELGFGSNTQMIPHVSWRSNPYKLITQQYGSCYLTTEGFAYFFWRSPKHRCYSYREALTPSHASNTPNLIDGPCLWSQWLSACMSRTPSLWPLGTTYCLYHSILRSDTFCGVCQRFVFVFICACFEFNALMP